MGKRTLGILVASTALLVGGVAGLAACGSSNSAATSGGAVAPKGPSGTEAAPTGNAGEGGSTGSDLGAATPPKAAPGAVTSTGAPILTPGDVSRAVIHNGTITLRVDDVDAAANSAEALATGSGGYVGGDDRTLDGGRSTATVTLRVPSDRFDATMTALARLGSEQSRQISTQDVTEQVVDVQSRLATQQASVDRIRQLIANTTSINEIISLEDELTQRESDLESMEAQLRSLTDLTALSTIAAVFIGPQAKTPTPPATKQTGFIGGLKSGWSGFLTAIRTVLTGIGAALPFVITIAVLLAIWLLIRRRRRPAARVES